MIIKSLIFSAVAITMVLTSRGAILKKENGLSQDQARVEVPLGGNTFRLDGHGRSLGTESEKIIGGEITEKGIVNWTDHSTLFKTYIRFAKKGTIKVWLKLSVPAGESQLEIKALGRSIQLTVKSDSLKTYYAGEFKVTDTGYVDFVIKGIKKTGKIYANISSFQLSGAATTGLAFVKNNEGNYFYWGRRGPSVHLSYPLPENTQAEWFYNEVKVPEKMDVTGSYFMADGFGEGYFGMQVNSATERRILFSVWSPFNTDDPAKIPEDQKIKMLNKGANVHTGEFGNEGSGGQSYLRFNWKAGIAYKFLLNAQPDAANHTKYTAWFYDPQKSTWLLIASFNRPGKSTYLTHLHSFLENFEPETGDKARSVEFNNQWIRTTNGKWMELNKAKFTGDNTARKGYRMDYNGGTVNGSFFLRNCGFFNNYTVLDQIFERPLAGKQPDVDLEHLPR